MKVLPGGDKLSSARSLCSLTLLEFDFENMQTPLEQITSELMSTVHEKPLSRQLVDGWFASSDLETMGALFKLLHDSKHYSRISPPLQFDDYKLFHLKYYERCLRENSQGTWFDSRYIAAHSLVAWFKGLWNDETISREALKELKTLLGRLYCEGDEKLKICIITGALEHLFTENKILSFFSDWKHNPKLRQAYYEATGYAGNILNRARQP